MPYPYWLSIFKIVTLFGLYRLLLFSNFEFSLEPSKSCPKHIAGLILARGGSRGIPKKNVALLDGRPLIAWTLDILSQSSLSTVWVSTDNEIIVNESKKAGKNVSIHWRSEQSATDEATSIFAAQEFLHYHPEIEALVLVQCTSPFIKLHYLEEAIFKLKNDFDSVFSVTRQYKLRWKKEGNSIKPDNFNPSQRPRRQDWSGELIENGMIYAARSELIREGYFQKGRIGIVEVDVEDSLEIDTPRDLAIANVLVKARHI